MSVIHGNSKDTSSIPPFGFYGLFPHVLCFIFWCTEERVLQDVTEAVKTCPISGNSHGHQ